MSSLSDLLRPLELEEFARDVWNRAPHLARRAVVRPEDLLDLPALEQLISAMYRPEDGWLQLAREGRRPLPPQMLGDDGMVKLRELYTAFAQGDSLYLTKMERISPPLTQAARAIERDLTAIGIPLRKAVAAHVFLSPPNARAFPLHRDDHASLVVQLEGTKAWRVYDRTTESTTTRGMPTRAGSIDPMTLRAEIRRFTLAPGDVLYVPEGWAHAADAEDGYSLHVTFGLYQLRWSDVVAALAERHPALAEPVPRLGLDDGVLGDVLDSDAFREPLRELVEQIARERAVPSRVLPDDGLRQVLTGAGGGLTLDSELAHRAGVTCHVYLEGERACIAFPGNVIRGPAVLGPVFRYVATTTRFSPRMLPAIGARYDRLEVARMLVREGLLRHTGDTATSPIAEVA